MGISTRGVPAGLKDGSLRSKSAEAAYMPLVDQTHVGKTLTWWAALSQPHKLICNVGSQPTDDARIRTNPLP